MSDIYASLPYTTPGRSTTLRLDMSEQIVTASHYGGVRFGPDIAKGSGSSNRGADSQFTNQVRYWPGPRVWTLQPVQEKNSRFHEILPVGVLPADFVFDPSPGTHGIGSLVRAAIAGIAGALIKVPMQGLPGAYVVGDDINPFYPTTVGDYLYYVRYPATGPGSVSYSDAMVNLALHPPQNTEAASGVPQLAAPATRLFPVMYSLSNQRADQGFFLRWSVPGSQHQYPDYLWNFWFGQYMLAIKGDGTAALLEYCRPAGSQTKRWVFRTSFRYSNPSAVLNATHTMTIFPVMGAGGERYIVFSNNQVDAGSVYGPSTDNAEYTWLADDTTRNGDQDEAPGHVTCEAPVRIDHRRDLRVAWHVSQLIFSAQGTITDRPWGTRVATNILGSSYPPYQLDFQAISRQPGSGYSVGLAVYDAASGIAYNPADTTTWPQVKTPFAVITLTAPAMGSGTVPSGTSIVAQAAADTPVFYGYRLGQNAIVSEFTPGELSTPVRSVSVEGPDMSPENEKAVVEIFDDTNALSRLAARGEITAQLQTTFTPRGTSTEQTVILFRGVCQAPRKTRTGRMDAAAFRTSGTIQGEPGGGFNMGAPVVYPDPESGFYSLAIAGMARRLMADEKNLSLIGLTNLFMVDPAAGPITLPDGTVVAQQPWKVTDAMRMLLQEAGFTSGQIQIPDRPIRLFPGEKTTTEDVENSPIYLDFLSQLVRYARNYLGAVLVFDPNWPPSGAWTIIENAGEPGQTPLFAFQTYPAVDGVPPHLEDSYPANTGFVTGPLESYVRPPDYDRIIVATENSQLLPGYKGPVIAADMANPKSYKVPASGVTLDPDNPHCIGHERVNIQILPELAIGGPYGALRTQSAVNYVCRRLFDYTCLARKIQPVNAPLYFVQDPVHLAWRPPRYGDPVTYDGEPYFVRSVNPSYELDTHQVAYYELEQTVPIYP